MSRSLLLTISRSEDKELKGHTDAVFSVAFSADGKRIVSGSYDNAVIVWDADKGTETLTLPRNYLAQSF
jgi:WD40 repeat protein